MTKEVYLTSMSSRFSYSMIKRNVSYITIKQTEATFLRVETHITIKKIEATFYKLKCKFVSWKNILYHHKGASASNILKI